MEEIIYDVFEQTHDCMSLPDNRIKARQFIQYI